MGTFGWGRMYNRNWEQAQGDTSPFRRIEKKPVHYGSPKPGMPEIHRTEHEEKKSRFVAALKVISLALLVAPFAAIIFILWMSLIPCAIVAGLALILVVRWVAGRRRSLRGKIEEFDKRRNATISAESGRRKMRGIFWFDRDISWKTMEKDTSYPRGRKIVKRIGGKPSDAKKYPRIKRHGRIEEDDPGTEMVNAIGKVMVFVMTVGLLGWFFLRELFLYPPIFVVLIPLFTFVFLGVYLTWRKSHKTKLQKPEPAVPEEAEK